MPGTICLIEESAGVSFWIRLNRRLILNQPSLQSFVCPHCQQVQQANLWEGVNVSLAPELKSLVLSRDLFSFTCSGCARILKIVHPFLYLDPALKLAIWLPCVEAQKPPLEEGSTAMALMTKAGYSFRLVKTYDELIEKIRTFDERQGERVAEGQAPGYDTGTWL